MKQGQIVLNMPLPKFSPRQRIQHQERPLVSAVDQNLDRAGGVRPKTPVQQIRGYINLRDTIRCIELTIASPPGEGEYRVFNQFTEQFSLVELAAMVVRQGERFGLEAQIEHLPNPRVEAEQHYYNAAHTRLIELGLEPHLLNGSVLESLIGLAIKHREQIDRKLILPTVNWRTTKNEVSHADG